MKKIIFLLMGALLIISSKSFSIQKNDKENAVNIVCSPDLFYLIEQWSGEYNKLYPEKNINVIEADSKEFSEILSINSGMGFISDKYNKLFESKSLWEIVIGRKIIVPIVNGNNPFMDKIIDHGISSIELSKVITSSSTKYWNSLLDNNEKNPIKFYTTMDKSIQLIVAGYLGLNPMEIEGLLVKDSKELVSKIQNDPYAIGFCNLTDVINTTNLELVDNIKLLPIDNNGNGKIDYFEKIYSNLNDFKRGVWIGKYPKLLTTNIYSVSNGLPKNEEEIAFLRWVITEGQQMLNQNGFCELVFSERQSKLEKLIGNERYSENTKDQYSVYKGLLIIITFSIVLLAGLLFFIAIIQKNRNVKRNIITGISKHPKVINENSLIIPKGVYFDKTHTWVFMEKNGIIRVGIDDFLQHVTGRLTCVKIKNPGDKVKKNEHILSLIQNGKQINICAPISGTIKEFNESIITLPSIINVSPFNEGWIYLIEPSNWTREVNFLIMSEKYKEWIKNEFLRLKDFLATSLKTEIPEHSFVLQEGGEIIDNVLYDLEPSIWEDFQTNFLNTSKLS